MIALPPFAYAEIHYRFKYFFSLLKKAEPEILADVPHRLEPNSPLTVLLLVKDAHRYPVKLLESRVEVTRGDTLLCSGSLLTRDQSVAVSDRYWYKVIPLELPTVADTTTGVIYVKVIITYEVAGKIRTCVNDNYRTSSHAPLRVYRSLCGLPRIDGWILGDNHIHSSYTEDQVEFGVPLAPAIGLSKAMGLSYFCVADHSYDLDDRYDSYLQNDPSLPKWNRLQAEIDALDVSQKDFAVIRGEEVSCRNAVGRNVHLLLHGNRRFVPGSGDSAERWFRTRSEHTLAEVLGGSESGSIAYASHPTEPTPLLQRLLIHRGRWSDDDLSLDGLCGMQILNGEDNVTLQTGVDAWRRLLLKGKRLFVSAGNDAHGNFSRFRQIGVPFVRIVEADKQLFGRMRTALRCEQATEEAILGALRSGRSTISNGPLVALTCRSEDGRTVETGGEVDGSRTSAGVEAVSTREFGRFSEIHVIMGTLADRVERIIASPSSPDGYRLKVSFPISVSSPSYVRIEAYTTGADNGSQRGFSLTNPIWITPPEQR